MSIAKTDFADRFYLGFGAILAQTAAAIAAAFARAERSHHRRLGFSTVSPETLRDIRMAAEDITGLPSQEPDLPFFMQSDFGRR